MVTIGKTAEMGEPLKIEEIAEIMERIRYVKEGGRIEIQRALSIALFWQRLLFTYVTFHLNAHPICCEQSILECVDSVGIHM